jgi:hypothetical protein
MRRLLPFLCAALLLFGQGASVNPPTALTVMVDGAVIGSTTTLNLVSGPGIVWTKVAGPAGQINVQAAVNTASIVNKNILQSGVCTTFAATNTDGSAYAVSGAPGCQKLQAMPTGPFLFVPSTPNAAGATITFDNFGPYSIYMPGGTAAVPAGTLQPGFSYWMWFNGTAVQLVAAP